MFGIISFDQSVFPRIRHITGKVPLTELNVLQIGANVYFQLLVYHSSIHFARFECNHRLLHIEQKHYIILRTIDRILLTPKPDGKHVLHVFVLLHQLINQVGMKNDIQLFRHLLRLKLEFRRSHRIHIGRNHPVVNIVEQPV